MSGLSDYLDDENKEDYEYRKRDPYEFIREPIRPGTVARASETEPAGEWGDYSIPLAAVKNYLKIEHDYDDPVIEQIIEGAIQEAKIRTNRNYLHVPQSVTIAIYKIIAYWYENRGETDVIPAEAAEIFRSHYKSPGL